MRYIIYFIAGAIGGYILSIVDQHRREKKNAEQTKDDPQPDNPLPFKGA